MSADSTNTKPRLAPFASPGIEQLSPYVPGELPKNEQQLKLNTNENPYPPSPHAIAAAREAAGEALRLYPDPDSRALKQAIASHHGVDVDRVFVGNGSDEVLAHAFRGFFVQSQPLLFPDVSYSFYPVYAALFGIQTRTVALDDTLALRLDDYPTENGGIVFPNPNAPTGRAIGLDEIERLLSRNTASVVLVDEAYVDFGAESAVALTSRFANLLVVQTLSKSRSLAGLRVGYAIGAPALIAVLETVKGSFNSYPIDRVAQAAATASFGDPAHFEQCRQAIIRDRDWLSTELESLGFVVLPSATNFLFARHPGHTGAALRDRLRERDILVRHFDRPRTTDYLRITIGTAKQCQRLRDTLAEILAA